ncbi:MAG TPA: hypothetical protein VGI61_05080, partial [Parafilimonas sp.]
MAEPSTHINYSFEDIQRYLQGKMSTAEMHDIEKAALQDPFLADAIEGFNEADAATAQQHLNEINSTLLKEKKESKVIAFNKKTQWFNVAVLIIVLAGIGVVASYFFKSSNTKTQIAQVKNEPVKNEVLKDSSAGSVSTLTKKPDTNSFVAENKSLQKELKKHEPVAIKKNDATKNISNENIEENKANISSVAAAPVQLNQSNEAPAMDTVRYDLKTTRSFAAA